MRIVSLLPSATEILGALGLADRLVGVTHGCDFPAEVARLPRVTTTCIPHDAPSGEIDRLVRERHAAGLPLYDLDARLLAELRPDMLVTQGLCDVCAVPDHAVTAVAAELPGAPQVVSLAPRSLADVLSNITELGARTGRQASAAGLVQSLTDRISRIRTRTAGLTQRPRVTLLEWVDPLYACGHWTPELVELAGGREGHGRAGAPSRRMAWQEVVEWSPEVMVLACCGLNEQETLRELALLAERPGFLDLPCTVSGRVFVVDGAAYFSRSSPRLVDSLEILAAMLHPARFPDPPVSATRVGRWPEHQAGRR